MKKDSSWVPGWSRGGHFQGEGPTWVDFYGIEVLKIMRVRLTKQRDKMWKFRKVGKKHSMEDTQKKST